MSIRLVTFDLDNTLWDSIEVLRLATTRLNEWLGEHEPEYLAMSDEKHRQIHQEVLSNHPEVRYDVSANRILHMEACFKDLGHSQKSAMSLALDAFKVFMHWRCQVDPYPGAEELLAQLRENYLLASITNGNSDISLTSLAPYFMWNVNPAIAKAAKPDNRIFEYTLHKANVDSPKEAVHIGDSVADDYWGAVNAGFHALLYNPDQESVDVERSHCIQYLESIPNKLRAFS